MTAWQFLAGYFTIKTRTLLLQTSQQVHGSSRLFLLFLSLFGFRYLLMFLERYGSLLMTDLLFKKSQMLLVEEVGNAA